MGQLKSNTLKADRPSMEVPCYPTAWSLFNPLSWKRSENQEPSNYTAHTSASLKVLVGMAAATCARWNGTAQRVSLWNYVKPILLQGSGNSAPDRNGCSTGMSAQFSIDGSLVLPCLQETSALCQSICFILSHTLALGFIHAELLPTPLGLVSGWRQH